MAAKKATTKTAAKKESAATKTVTKKATTKTAVKKTAAKTTDEKKSPATKAAPAKKAAAKKPAKEPKVNAVIQYQDLEFSEASCIKKAQAGFKKAHKGVDLKDISIYIKPEEGKIYYVANGDIDGSVDL